MSKIQDLTVERLALGELSEDEARRAREALGAGVDARLAALRQDDARVLATYPPEQMIPRIRQRAEAAKARSPRALVLFLAPALAGAAALALALGSGVTERVTETPDTVRIKGDAALVLRVLRQGRLQPSGAPAQAGDVVQLSVRGAPSAAFGVVVSIDGRGHVTRHLPEEGAAAAALDGREQALPHAYELDDAPAFERFVLVTGPRAFDVAAVLAAAAALPREEARTRALSLPDGLAQRSVVLDKRGAP